MTDADTENFLNETLSGRRTLLHGIFAQDPLAAMRCFHYTVRLVIDTLFNSAQPGSPHPAGIASNTLPGVFGHIAGYLGVVEPQMRKALHIHMLIQLHGFANPVDLLYSGEIAKVFRRMWHFVASICFRSVEGFAAYTKEKAATDILTTLPLLPITKKQRMFLGNIRSEEATNAQLSARGLKSAPAMSCKPRIKFYVPTLYSNATVPAADYAAFAVSEVNTGSIKVGSHVCLPHVCFKGRGCGRLGFCRMLFWHWTQITTKK